MPAFSCLPRYSSTYKRTLDELHVETDLRFRRRDITGDGRKETFCNQAVEAACEALDVHLPQGLLARAQLAWLESPDGRAAGWFECSKTDADTHAGLGHPTIVGWTNPDPGISSHVAMLRSAGRIWQAGRENYNDAPLVNGFGARPVRYFVHL